MKFTILRFTMSKFVCPIFLDRNNVNPNWNEIIMTINPKYLQWYFVKKESCPIMQSCFFSTTSESDTMATNTAIIFLYLILFCSKVQANLYYDVAVFCKNNGLNYLTVSSLPHLSNATNQLVREINQQFLPFRQLSFDQVWVQ